MAEKQFGGWYQNPSQSNKTMRWWGGNTWTTGEDPTGGRGVNWQSTATPSASTSATTTPATSAIDWTSILKSQDEARKTSEASKAAQEADLLNRYKTAVSGQESVSAMASRIGTELGLPELKKSASTLTSTLEAIPTTQTTAAMGKDVSANQLARIIAAKQAGLAPSAQKAITQAQTAQGELGTRLGYETTQQAKELQPYTLEASLLSDRLARETTGFSDQQQNELNVLLEKYRTDVALSAAEIKRLQDLADAETTFENEKEKIVLQTNEDIRKSRSTATDTDQNIQTLFDTLNKLEEMKKKNISTSTETKPTINHLLEAGNLSLQNIVGF